MELPNKKPVSKSVESITDKVQGKVHPIPIPIQKE